MKRLIYHADPQHVLVEGDQRISGGDEFTVSDDRALELLTDPSLTILEAPDADLFQLTRPQLDEHARVAGIADPEKYRNKGELIEAIDALAQTSGNESVDVTDPGIHPQPEATGDGPNPETDSQKGD